MAIIDILDPVVRILTFVLVGFIIQVKSHSTNSRCQSTELGTRGFF